MKLALAVLIAAGGTAAALAAERSTLGEAERNAMNARTVAESYPAESIARGEQGIVNFRIALDNKGRLKSCVVTRSSGYPRLDRATCEMMLSARYKAVEDERDWRVASQHDGAVLWEHPTGMPAPPKVRRSSDELDKEKLICERAQKQGSLYVRTSLCLTAEDWRRARFNGRRETIRLQDANGSTI